MILVVDMNHEKDSLGFYEFVLPIVSIVKEHDECRVSHYKELSGEELARADRIVLSGTPLRNREYLDHVQEFQWLAGCGRPVLGICAGMQIIALVFDSSLERCLEIGMTKIRTTKRNPLFEGTFEAYELHNFSITPPTEFEVLAESKRCVQAIKHRERTCYGILFHPEVRNRNVVERFCRL